MYVNGEYVARDVQPQVRAGDQVDRNRNNDFTIGRPNDGCGFNLVLSF